MRNLFPMLFVFSLLWSCLFWPVAAWADLTLTRIGPGLDYPWGMDFLDDTTVLITERDGNLLRMDMTTGNTVRLSGVPRVRARGQGGLLDVMVTRRHDGKDEVWLCYAAPKTGGGDATTIGRGVLGDDSLKDFTVLFTAAPPVDSRQHFGCRLGQLADGTIVATLGERGNRNNAQNPQTHPGSVIRLNTDGTAPADNPFSDGRGWLPELFSIGNRNPQGLAIHPTTGELWIHEHGPQGGDEINIVRGGENFGWPVVSFGEEYGGGSIGIGTTAPEYTAPVHHWTPSIAPSGMAFYTGDMFPRMRGGLLVGSLKFELLLYLSLDGNTVVAEYELIRGKIGRIRDVAVASDGAILLLTDRSNGGLWRLGQ